MSEFTYVAINATGKEVKGKIEATDEAKAKAQLKALKLIPTSVAAQSLLTKDIDIHIGNPVKPRDISVFCRQITSILNAGVTVVSALDMLSEQTENKVFRKAIAETKMAVERGDTLAQAMRSCGKIYPSLLINMVEAGEASGSLDVSFSRMADYFEKSTKLKALVKKAMIYPIMLLVVTVVVVIIMSVVVVPKFVDMFSDLGSELPGITKIVMAVSDFMIHKWYVLLIVVALTAFLLRFFAGLEAGQIFFGKLKIKLPIFGIMAIKNASASFARTLSTLVSSGLSISTALEIVAKSMSNILYRRAIIEAKNEVERGIPLSSPIKASGLFPAMIPHMLKIGEETGNIEGMLDKCAEYYEEEVEIQTQSLTSSMEPLIIVVMGVIIGFIVVALYMPMIDMYSGMENL